MYHLDITQGIDDVSFAVGDLRYKVKLVSSHNDDVPSLKKEPLIWCLDDFLAGFDIEATSLVIPEADIYEYFATS